MGLWDAINRNCIGSSIHRCHVATDCYYFQQLETKTDCSFDNCKEEETKILGNQTKWKKNPKVVVSCKRANNA